MKPGKNSAYKIHKLILMTKNQYSYLGLPMYLGSPFYMEKNFGKKKLRGTDVYNLEISLFPLCIYCKYI